MNKEVCIKAYPYDVEYEIADIRTHFERGWIGRTVVDAIEIEITEVNELPAEMWGPQIIKLLRDEMYDDVLCDAREEYEYAHLDDEMDAAFEARYR
jgi:hypothetical protein